MERQCCRYYDKRTQNDESLLLHHWLLCHMYWKISGVFLYIDYTHHISPVNLKWVCLSMENTRVLYNLIPKYLFLRNPLYVPHIDGYL